MRKLPDGEIPWPIRLLGSQANLFFSLAFLRVTGEELLGSAHVFKQYTTTNNKPSLLSNDAHDRWTLKV